MSDFSSPPERPLDSDCCGSGCNPCILDVYEKNLARWKSDSKPSVKSSDILSDVRYSPFKLISVSNEAVNVNIYTFQAVREKDGCFCDISGDLGIRMGQHLMMKAEWKDGTKFSRAFTPISQSNGQFRILVKLYDSGQMSKYFAELQTNDIEYFRGPYGDFRYVSNRYRKVVMLCCGTGLAAMIGLVREIVEDDSDDSRVIMKYSVRNVQEVLLRDELIELGGFWNFSCVIYVTRGEAKGRFQERIMSGRIEEKDVREEITTDSLVLICGTEEFSKDMSAFVANCDTFVF